MSILTKVEAKGWRGRLFLSGVTLTLILGGTTMLYPFMLMISGAMRSDMDSSDMSLIPEYLVNDNELVGKYLETKYNYDPNLMNRFRQGRDYSFREASVPEELSDTAIADLGRFFTDTDLPTHWQVLGGTELRQGISCENHRMLVERLRERFDDDLVAFNALLGAPVRSWWLISVRLPRWAQFRTGMPDSPLHEAYFELMHESDPAERALVNLSGLFLENIVYPAYGRDHVARFSEKHGLQIDDYADFSLPQRVPSGEQETLRDYWLDFLFDDYLNLSFIRSDASDEVYRQFLENRFETIDTLREYWHDVEYTSFDQIRLPDDKAWIPDYMRAAYLAFLRSLPPESLRLVGPEYAWRDFLREKYGDPASAAKAHQADYQTWDDCKPPIDQMETRYVLDHARSLRHRYAVRNFRLVGRQMFVQGRPFLNTIIYVGLALLFALTLQPLVAYSLSRFQPPGTWKFIFIFVATMAFPPMVGMIPQFLIIQRLNLLNTFFALVLPVTINGMLIFLLKGFFDSIPKDLYDAAVIDGASEFRIFWQITMSMSTPILAVVALQTFSGAWMAFMYPLIVCPDESMHVLAVWLQQFQQQAPGTAVFASIIIASIPSLLIFLFAQRTIMRGIAVPSEK